MGRDLDSNRARSRKNSETSSSSSSSESPERRRRSSRHRESNRHRSRHRSGEDNSEKSRKRKARRRDKEDKKRSKHRRKSQSDSSSSDGDSHLECSEPTTLVRLILKKFPDVANDLKQLLQMMDNGQAVDTRGISNRALVKLLKKLFWSLKLKQNENGVFLLPPMAPPTLEVIGSTLCLHLESRRHQISSTGLLNERQPAPSNPEFTKDDVDVERLPEPDGKHESSAPCKRRLIGPEMPSRELLAAAAELTEADNALREADLEVDSDLFIGPPPPAVVAEAESANEAERFEEVARIAEAEVDKPYDVLGVNWKMSFDNIKKRYWKLSLMVHPDKCSHPEAHQAFVKLNQAFKELQDPDKRKIVDERFKLKEEQEAFKAELQSLREAAQWRRLQGISMEGDDELLAVPKEAPKREEWMTTLPPERKPGMTMQSTSFSKTGKEGRGDTSIWTDNPLDKAGKAKQNYLEAYNKAATLAATDEEKKRPSSEADLVENYNRSKRSIPLVQKFKEERSRPKKKSKQQDEEEWAGQHPWKPWDREKDLTAGRMKVNIDSENMAQGLTSRFASGNVQRNFL